MRALFGGDPMLTETNGIVRLNKSSRTLTFYDAETGGAQVTDLLAADGTTATSTVTTTGSVVPPFYGPDGVVLLWADAGDGNREPMRGAYPEAALSAAFARKAGAKVVAVGDSHFEGGQQGDGSDWRTTGNRPMGAAMYAWGLWHTGGKFMSVGNWAKGGERTDQILGRIAGPLASGADVALIQMGTNDARQGYTLAHTVTNYTETVRQLREAGMDVICVGLPPINDPTTVRDAMDRINNWLRSFCATERIPFVEVMDLMVNTADRTFATGTHTDGVHLTATAADLAGRRIADALLRRTGQIENVFALTNVDATNLLPNALFLNDAGADGLPDSWYGLGAAEGGTMTQTLEPVTGWVGNAVHIAQGANTNARQVYTDININTGKFAVGDRLRLAARLKTDGGVIAFVQAKFVGSTAARTESRILDCRSTEDAELGSVQEFTVPTGTTNVQVYVYVGAGTGDVWFGQPSLVNLTTLGISSLEYAPGNGW